MKMLDDCHDVLLELNIIKDEVNINNSDDI